MSPAGVDWNAIEWEDLVPRLLLLAVHSLRRFSGRDSRLDPNDLVFGAIQKTLSGARDWNPAKTSLFHHLAGVISSDIYNLRRQLIAHPTVPLDDTIAESVESDAPSAEQSLAFKTELAETLAFLRNSDERVAEMAEAIVLLGDDSAQDLAVLLGLPIETIYERKRQLRRLLTSRSKQAS